MTIDGGGGRLPMPGRSRIVAPVLGLIVGVFVLVTLIASCSGFSRPAAGEVGVIRNGGPFDDRNIRQVLAPGTGITWTGFFSSEHFYPSSSVQRFYTITSDQNRGDRAGFDVVQVQTADGVRVGIEGTFYFTTAFDGTARGTNLVREFDQRFGVRKFPVQGGGEERAAWQGDDGWNAFLDTIVRPVIDNELRQAVLKFKCDQLISSCALVTSQGQASATANRGGATNTNLQNVQDEVEKGFASDLEETLGGEYLTNVRFRLVRVVLPDEVQTAINQAQAAFAQVAQARAKVQSAEQEALANKKRQEGYNACPACVSIDQIRAVPDGATVVFGAKPVVTANPKP